MRVFLDTNVLVSAFATRGLCADLVRHILAEHELIVGEVVLAELRRVLAGRIHLPKALIQEIDRLHGHGVEHGLVAVGRRRGNGWSSSKSKRIGIKGLGPPRPGKRPVNPTP